MDSDLTISRELDSIVSIHNGSPSDASIMIGNFIGFIVSFILPDPISWLIGPIIELWRVQAEIKRIELRKMQLLEASAVAKERLRIQLRIHLAELERQQHEFEKKAKHFDVLIKEFAHHRRDFAREAARIRQLTEQEKDSTKHMAYCALLRVLYKCMSTNFSELCDSFNHLYRDSMRFSSLAIQDARRMLEAPKC